MLGGKPYQTGVAAVQVPGNVIVKKYPSAGGFLARYLPPVVLAIERRTNPPQKGNEAYGWLPPPLMGEGEKVQTKWLYEFLWSRTRFVPPLSCGCRSSISLPTMLRGW